MGGQSIINHAALNPWLKFHSSVYSLQLMPQQAIKALRITTSLSLTETLC